MDKPNHRTTEQAILSQHSPTNARWVVLGLVAFASASAYLTRYCISAANTTIQSDLGFSDGQMGLVMSAFGFGYLLFQVPGGWLGNRFGTRFAFALISALWSLCNAWSAAAAGIAAMLASRFSLGVFQAGLTPISAKVLMDWIPLGRRGISSASIGACMSVGGAATLWWTGSLLDSGYGWRHIFLAYSLVGIVWAIAFYWYFRTCPREHRGVNQAERALIGQRRGAADSDAATVVTIDPQTTTAESGVSLLLRMLSSRSLWGLYVQSFFRAAGYLFFVTWFFAFLEYAYAIGKEQAGLLNSLPLIAVVAGTSLGGVIVDLLLYRTGSPWLSRTGTATGALAVCGLFTLGAAWTNSATQLAIVIAVGALFSGIGSPAAWAATIDVGGKHTALVMGTMNMAGCVAGVVMPAVLGDWIDHIKQTGGDWNSLIYLHAAFYFAGAIAWLAVNPNDRPTDPGHCSVKA